VRPLRARSGKEKLNAIRNIEGWNEICLLAAKLEELTARHQHVEVGAGCHHSPDLRGGLDDVLEVVQQQQQALVCDVLGHHTLRPERCPGCLQHQLWVPKRRQRRPENAVTVVIRRRAGRLQRQPGLAGSARADQGQHPYVAAPQQVDDRDEVRLLPRKGVAGTGRLVRPSVLSGGKLW
jgi:hypothetical protein